MRKLILLMILLAPLLWHETGHAAPGSLVVQWGTPHAFYYPFGIAVDSGGNLYVTQQHKVQVFDRNGTLVRAWGSYGSGNGQFAYPGGVAVAGNRVYVCDAGNNRMQIFDSTGNFIKSFGSYGTGNGMFYYPSAVATDRNGNVYVADSDNYRVQIFDSNGNFLRTFGSPGNGNNQFSLLEDVAVDSAGRIYTVDDVTIKVFDNQGNYLRSWQAHGTGGDPRCVAVDSTGNVYVGVNPYSDFLPPEKVQVFDSNGNFLREWGSFGYGDGQFYYIGDIAIDSANAVYVDDVNNQRIEVFDSSGKFVRKVGGVSANGQFYQPYGAATDSSGNVYVTDSLNYRVQVFNSGGTFLRKWGSQGSGPGQFSNPVGIAVDSAGNVYVSDPGGGELGHAQSLIQVFNGSGNFLRSWGFPAGQYGESAAPFGVAVDGSGRVYASDVVNHRIIVFGSSGNVIRSWGSFGSGDGQFSSPLGVALDSYGNVYVADEGNHRIQVFNGAGEFLRKWGSEGSGDGQFLTAAYVAIDASGNVYVTDDATKRVQVFDATGKFLGKWGSYGSAPGQFLSPQGIAAGGTTVYVVDSNNDRVSAFTGFGNALPPGWSSRDIGYVGLAGQATFAGGTFTLQGSGGNIWGTADGFRYVYKPLAGDGEIVARVTAVQNTNGFAKGGVMIRETLTPGSRHAMVDITPSSVAEFSRRVSTGATTSASVIEGISAPYWVKLVRKGSTFSAYIGKDGINWTSMGSATIGMAGSVYVGLIDNSHNNSVLCTAKFDGVSLAGQSNTPTVTVTAPAAGSSYTAPASVTVTAGATAGSGAALKAVEFYAGGTLIGTSATAPYKTVWNNVTAGSYSLTAKVIDTLDRSATSTPVPITVSSALPAPWQSRDIGSVGVAGSAGYLNGAFTLKGSGADIWGTADAFRFVYKTLTGNGQIVARVASVQNTNPYAKGGVMMREALTAGSKHAMMDLRPTGGAEFSRRTTTGGTTSATTKTGIGAPYWVKLVRSGSTLTGSVSSDGVNWVQVGSSTISMTSTIYVGLIVNSHYNSVLCTSTLDHVQ